VPVFILGSFEVIGMPIIVMMSFNLPNFIDRQINQLMNSFVKRSNATICQYDHIKIKNKITARKIKIETVKISKATFKRVNLI
jgi:hypothetical protein